MSKKYELKGFKDLEKYMWYTDLTKLPKKLRKLYQGKTRQANKRLIREELKDI